MTGTPRRAIWLGAAITAVVVAVVAAGVAVLWSQVGDSDITAAGWIAMLLGTLLALGLGVGLMALVFISNRRGYDEQ